MVVCLVVQGGFHFFVFVVFGHPLKFMASARYSETSFHRDVTDTSRQSFQCYLTSRIQTCADHSQLMRFDAP
jgi:hypothetical protein